MRRPPAAPGVDGVRRRPRRLPPARSPARSRARSSSPEIRAPTVRSPVVRAAERTIGAGRSRPRERVHRRGQHPGEPLVERARRGRIGEPANRLRGRRGPRGRQPPCRRPDERRRGRAPRPPRTASRSVRPTASARLRKPSAASSRRTSSARAVKKATTCSGVPVNFARRSSRWVAMPVGQVSRWHWRAMSQPIATSAAVPKPYSSAPRSAAITTSRPVWSPPSVRRTTRSRRPWRTRTWWASARPSSHGAPTDLIDESGLAPVPPAWPQIRT